MVCQVSGQQPANVRDRRLSGFATSESGQVLPSRPPDRRVCC
jgi:hypothetical protein